MRKQLANYPILGIFSERKSPEFRYAQEADRPNTWVCSYTPVMSMMITLLSGLLIWH
jgi:hypothetical protein